METKEVELGIGKVNVRGITAGEAAYSADVQKSIDKLYSKDPHKHAEETNKVNFSMLAKCIVLDKKCAYEDGALESALMNSPPSEISKLNKLIQELTTVPEDIEKNLEPSSGALISEKKKK